MNKEFKYKFFIQFFKIFIYFTLSFIEMHRKRYRMFSTDTMEKNNFAQIDLYNL